MKILNICIYWWVKTLCSLTLIIQVLIVFVINNAESIPFNFNPLFGQIFAVFGALIHLSHYYFLKKENSHLSKPDLLVTKGLLFRWIRHPMYLGDFILMIGLTCLTTLASSYIVLVIGCLSVYFQARVEDNEMSKIFGDDFKHWKLKTGLLFPRINFTSF